VRGAKERALLHGGPGFGLDDKATNAANGGSCFCRTAFFHSLTAAFHLMPLNVVQSFLPVSSSSSLAPAAPTTGSSNEGQEATDADDHKLGKEIYPFMTTKSKKRIRISDRQGRRTIQ
jgi:hypothetical protein